VAGFQGREESGAERAAWGGVSGKQEGCSYCKIFTIISILLFSMILKINFESALYSAQSFRMIIFDKKFTLLYKINFDRQFYFTLLDDSMRSTYMLHTCTAKETVASEASLRPTVWTSKIILDVQKLIQGTRH
jgi:hypothetical protein